MPNTELFIARQPIFDVTRDVVGYELLFRNGLANCFANIDGNEATRQVLLNTFVLFGQARLTGGKPAFINFTRDFLFNELVQLFPPSSVVVEILEDIPADESVIKACRQLKENGYSLALDDVTDLAPYGELLSLVDIVKVDLRATTSEVRREIIKSLSGKPIRVLGEKVETYEEFRDLVEEGFSLFQGYFFAKPEVIRRKDIPGNKVQYLRLLKELRKPTCNTDAIEKIIKQDVSLSYRLLKYVNSPLFGLRSEIRSVRHALTLLGERDVRRWTTLSVLSAVATDKPPEVLETGLFRAKFCETLASVVDRGVKEAAEEMFLAGLFSVLDALLDISLEDAVREAGVPSRVKAALLGVPSPWRSLLELAFAYERGEWEQVTRTLDTLGIEFSAVAQVFVNSVDWARQAAQSNIDARWSSHPPSATAE
jgi:EAL and modified HD-GYP domain-containing signal transduction protein